MEDNWKKKKGKSNISFLSDAFQGDSILGSSWNVVNSVIGTGCLFLPFAINDMGIIPGLFLIFIGSGCIVISHYIQLAALNEVRKDSHITPPRSQEELAKIAFRKQRLFSVLSWLCVKFIGLGYGLMGQLTLQIALVQILIGLVQAIFSPFPRFEPLLEKYVDFDNIFSRLIFNIIVFAGINTISLVEKIRSLRILSLVSIVCDSIVLLFIVSLLLAGFTTKFSSGQPKFLPDMPSENDFESKYIRILLVVLRIMKYGGKLVFSMITLSVCNIHSEFKNKSLHRLNFTIINSFVFITVFYGTMALFGYLSFLDNTNQMIILNYIPDDTNSNYYVHVFSVFNTILLRALTFTQIFLSYPVWNYVLAVAIDNFFSSVFSISSKSIRASIILGNPKASRPKIMHDINISVSNNEEEETNPSVWSEKYFKDIKETEDEEGDINNIISGKSDETKNVSATSSASQASELEEGGEIVVSEEKSDFQRNDSQSILLKKEKSFFEKHICSMKWLRFAVISTLMNFFIMLISVIYNHPQNVCGYGGGIFGSLIIFVIPPLLYLKVKKTSWLLFLVILVYMISAVSLLGIIPTFIMFLNEFEIGYY